MTVSLGYKPRAWQRKVHRARKRFSVLALHRRAGKTKLAVMELVDKASRFQRDLGLFFYVAPELKQATAIAWRELKTTLEPMRRTGAVTIREGDLSVVFHHNGAMIRLYGADNPDAMRGVRLDGVVLDEVAQMKPEVWTEIIQPALADRLGWALFIGTPKGINLFSELFFGAAERMAEGDENWYAARWTVHETDALAPEEVRRLELEMATNPQAWAREFLCDFSASGEDQLLSLADIDAAVGEPLQPGDIAHAPRIIGVDVARFGDDRSVIVRRQGRQLFPPEIMRGLDNMAVASRVANHIRDWQPAAVFIDGGGGAGVIDMLRHMNHRVIEVQFGADAGQPRKFKNRRTEMWCNMAEWVRAGARIPDILALRQELATPTYDYDPLGRLVLESKKQIKKRLQNQGSPDIADALALTFAAPVSPPNATHARKRVVVPEDHDPFE